jgi:hypothetical protein
MGREIAFFSVTEQDVIVCFVRINAFLPKIDVNDDKQYGCFESFPFRQHIAIFVRQITLLECNIKQWISGVSVHNKNSNRYVQF